ncbi:hypothetical protein JCM24511_04217 [Saitozyma sp. JCM 24511]|nr:hypothetical protein JCM24511_04217 [Saitozyma sp. JCM 24511]
MSPVTTRAAEKFDQVDHGAAQILEVQVPNDNPDDAMGHPLHPATVHWPIAFLSTSFGLVAFNALPSSITTTVSRVLPPLASLPKLAHYSAAAAVITAIPAIVAGRGEAYEIIRGQIKAKGSVRAVINDPWNMKDDAGRKLKMNMKHASLNDIVVLHAAVNWWVSKVCRTLTIRWHGYVYPSPALPTPNVVLSVVALPGLLYSFMLGGRMVYEYGVGVQPQGQGKEVKDKSE